MFFRKEEGSQKRETIRRKKGKFSETGEKPKLQCPLPRRKLSRVLGGMLVQRTMAMWVRGGKKLQRDFLRERMSETATLGERGP